MGAIVDTLFLGPKEIAIICAEFPNCTVINQSHSDHGIQRYRVIIPTDEHCGDNYYIFLIDNGIAMSSRNFLARIASDQRFVERMKSKVADSLQKMGEQFS